MRGRHVVRSIIVLSLNAIQRLLIKMIKQGLLMLSHFHSTVGLSIYYIQFNVFILQ